jgi:O-acetylhomoserine (thiol)-lyase
VGALGVASGHAAQFIVFHTLMEPGCEIVAAKKLYGGTLNQFAHSFAKFGWKAVFVDADDPPPSPRRSPTRRAACSSKASPTPVAWWDIAAIADVAHAAGVPLIVDNTMASPALCRPIEHGADIVVHSCTKFLNGHGNSIGGLIVDSGKFDWAASDKFPRSPSPTPATTARC